VFLAFSGEERGLRGSRYFTDQPTLPISSIVANINMDMIGRNVADSLVVIGQEYSTLGSVVRRVSADHPELGLTVYGDLRTSDRLVHRSDQHSFFRQGVPILWFFTGFHEDYHRPSDEVDRIDTDKAARIARFVFFVALEIAESAERPEWTTPDTGETVGSLTESRTWSGARSRRLPAPDR
jgi:Zn-dependent M28 family amino/carboxypeptidase